MAASLAFNSLDSRSSGRWGPESLTVTPDLSRVAKVARLSDCTLVLYFVQLCMCYCVCVAGGPELGCSVLMIIYGCECACKPIQKPKVVFLGTAEVSSLTSRTHPTDSRARLALETTSMAGYPLHHGLHPVLQGEDLGTRVYRSVLCCVDAGVLFARLALAAAALASSIATPAMRWWGWTGN